MEPVTPTTPMTTTTTAMPSTAALPTTTPYAEFISSAAANILSNGNSPMLPNQTPHEHYEHNQITFEIPTHRDLQHIDALHSFNTLLKRIGNVAYDTLATAAATTVSEHDHHDHLARDAAGQAITPEQISQSAVLNLADLKNGGAVGGFVDRFFAGADIHSIINYLWIGVVTSLIILSIIFIVFSCYFWRKFREWKKCNKDIRAQLNGGGAALHNGSNGEMLYPGGQRLAGVCDSLIGNVGGPASPEAAFYQIESPPCYTIATGLPTYDEALHHHQQHYAFGMKYIYPNIVALRHQQYHEQQQQQQVMMGGEGLKLQTQKEQRQTKVMARFDAPPAYDMAASVALLAAGGNNNNNSSTSDYEQSCVTESLKSNGERPTVASAQSIPQLSIICSTPSPQRQFEEKLMEVVIA